MTDKGRFTSDRRTPNSSSWADDSDWAAGAAEGVDVVGGGLVGRPPKQHSESPDSEVDRFEDYQPAGDVQLSDRYSGTLSNYSIGDMSSIQDTQSLYLRSGGVLQHIQAADGDGLLNLPEPGLEFACLVEEIGTGAFPYTTFGTSSTPSADTNYAVDLNTGDGEMRIHRRDSGTFNELASASISVSSDTVYDQNIEWHTDGTIVYTLHEVDQSTLERTSVVDTIQAADSTYDTPAAGFSNGSSTGSARWDNYRYVSAL